jgi:hypothetical protein
MIISPQRYEERKAFIVIPRQRISKDCMIFLLLPGAQQNPLHPFGGVNTR